MSNFSNLRTLFLEQGKKCYLEGNDTSCDVANHLITVFYDLGIGHEVEPLIEKAAKNGDENE